MYKWDYPIQNATETVQTAQPAIQQQEHSVVKIILEQQKLRTRQDLLRLRVAVDSAENIANPDRELLHDVYRQIILDPNLESQWGSRKMKTKERPFKVVDIASGEEDEALTEVLEADWFQEFIDAALDSKFWGFTLIEFGPMTPQGEFLPYTVEKQKRVKLYPAINCIDRDNVKPELGIITNTPGAITGLKMDDPQYANHLMFVGSFRSLGILHKCSKYILFKDNCLGNWSEWAEVFGMDIRVGYTDTQGKQREQFIRAVRDMGANAYAVINKTDELKFEGSARTDAYNVYKELIQTIDENIAKLIFGQDVVTNNTGRVVGTVGENVANMYGQADSRFIRNIVNKRLFPLMQNLGFNWQGKRFDWDTTEKVPLTDRAVIDKSVREMGYKLSQDYVEKTYGVETDGEVEPPQPTKLPPNQK